MIQRHRNRSFLGLMLTGLLAGSRTALASADYGPAVDRMLACAKYYTTGYGKSFVVIHDMEGYYLTGISYLRRCDLNASGNYNVSVSCHYVVNELKDYESDAERGEISQLVREANYSWHAGCWNRYSTGTEHEGFVSNPAWYTEEMYQASALLHRHLCDKFSIAKDRNHVIAHGQKLVPGWPTWASANLGIDPNCNTHTDPGPNWDWNHYMALLNDSGTVAQTTYTQTLTNLFANGTNGVNINATVAPNNSVTFSNAVKTAAASDTGGVFDFPSTIATGTTLYLGIYAGDTRRLQMTSSIGMQNATTGGGTFYPISNPNLTTTSTNCADFTLTLGPVYDMASDSVRPGETVSAIGFIVLSRTDAAYPLDVRATVTFNDGSTQAVTSAIGNVRGTDDTFFGFTAPAGLAITRLRLQSFLPGTQTAVANRIALDDFGFITSVEPWLTDTTGLWADDWQWTSGQPELQAQSPVDGSYLRLDSTNSATRNLMCQYQSSTNLDITKPHYIRWKFRLNDANFDSTFTSFNDRVHFFAHPVSRLGASTAAGNSWAILAAGDASAGAVGGKTFWIFDNVEGNGTFNVANQIDSHLLLRPNHIYSFQVLVLPDSRTYSVAIVDETSNVSFTSSAAHHFRDTDPENTHTFLHFGIQTSASILSRSFDLDSVSVTQAAIGATLLNPQMVGGTFTFSFASQSGFMHVVQYRDSLTAGDWLPLQSIPGDGTVKVATDNNPSNDTRFYRLTTQ